MGLRERGRSIHARCITCAAHTPRARSLHRRRRRIRGGGRDMIPGLVDLTRPLLMSMATQGARWTQCTSRAPRTPRTSRAPLPSTVRCARPALCIASEALLGHGCSRPLAPLACAGQSHHKVDDQSCGAHAGGASTCWVRFVAVRDARTVSRGAKTIRACGQRRR